MLCFKRDKVKIVLDRQTAKDLYKLLYSQGEVIAAGAPMPIPTPDEMKRLSVVFNQLEKYFKQTPKDILKAYKKMGLLKHE